MFIGVITPQVVILGFGLEIIVKAVRIFIQIPCSVKLTHFLLRSIIPLARFGWMKILTAFTMISKPKPRITT
jgi:hypothetical protein